MTENHNAVENIDRERIERAVREILEAVGEDPSRDGLVDTPSRVARMYAEVFRGLHEDPRVHMQTKFEVEHRELVLVRDIRFYSMCEHHLVPFFGRAHVGYVPGKDGTVAGLSKFARLVEGTRRDPRCRSGSPARSPMRSTRSSRHTARLSFFRPSTCAWRCVA